MFCVFVCWRAFIIAGGKTQIHTQRGGRTDRQFFGNLCAVNLTPEFNKKESKVSKKDTAGSNKINTSFSFVWVRDHIVNLFAKVVK